MTSRKNGRSEKDKHAVMSWIILELNAMYYNNRDLLGLNIHPSWEYLREISDENYEKKYMAYFELSMKLGFDPTAIEDINFDIAKASRRLVADKLSKPISSTNMPLQWPDVKTETQKEKLERLNFALNKLKKTKPKNKKVKKTKSLGKR